LEHTPVTAAEPGKGMKRKEITKKTDSIKYLNANLGSTLNFKIFFSPF